MAITLVDDLTEQSADGHGGTTVGSIDSTGATFIALPLVWYSAAGTTEPGVSDSKSNTILRGDIVVVDDFSFALYYIKNPSSVGSSHTFTVTGSFTFWGLGVSAWSGIAADPFQNEASVKFNGISGDTWVVPTITTEAQQTLLISMCGQRQDSVDINNPPSGWTAIGTLNKGATGLGIAHAYLIEDDNTAVGTTWTLSGNSSAVGALTAAFSEGTGGGGGGRITNAMLRLGVG